MDAVSFEPTHRCQICHREYKRLEHLKRHAVSHTRLPSHTCSACGGKFTRSDALKRHLRTCSHQHPDTSRVSRRRVCNHCAHTKKACDRGFPCQSCQTKGLDCSYSVPKSAQDDVDNDLPFDLDSGWLHQADPTEPINDFLDYTSASWNDFLNLLDPSIEFTDASDIPTLSFLDNFTKQTGLINSFDCGDVKMRQDALAFAKQGRKRSIAAESVPCLDFKSTQTMSSTCDAILFLIEEVSTIKPRNSAVDIVWSDDIRQSCSQFFHPSQLRQNIELYWTIWHPNVNIVHRPTFDITSAKPVLVAAMAVIGEY